MSTPYYPLSLGINTHGLNESYQQVLPWHAGHDPVRELAGTTSGPSSDRGEDGVVERGNRI